MLDGIKNLLFNKNRYRTNSESVIVACYYNPERSPYRAKAFRVFYDSIKHLNHRIVECMMEGSIPELPETPYIKRVYSSSTLWHKEALLNSLIAELPERFKYVFWLDADVIFTNLNWMVEGARKLQYFNVIQPFDLCVHLKKGELRPSFDIDQYRYTYLPNEKEPTLWRSFCANYVCTLLWEDEDYNRHGHVGFAWGAKREVLDACPLYDRALIGGADHIMAHAAVGQINHKCMQKSFTDDIDSVNEWSRKFAEVVDGMVGYVEGDLYHIWHGDLKSRQYLKRIKEFTKKSKAINERDDNGLYVADEDSDRYVKSYFKQREVKFTHEEDDDFSPSDVGLALDLAMATNIINEVTDVNSNDFNEQQPIEFGGGEFGGAGAGSSWGDDQSEVSTDTDNFS